MRKLIDFGAQLAPKMAPKLCDADAFLAVSYTHLTLPPILLVQFFMDI